MRLHRKKSSVLTGGFYIDYSIGNVYWDRQKTASYVEGTFFIYFTFAVFLLVILL